MPWQKLSQHADVGIGAGVVGMDHSITGVICFSGSYDFNL